MSDEIIMQCRSDLTSLSVHLVTTTVHNVNSNQGRVSAAAVIRRFFGCYIGSFGIVSTAVTYVCYEALLTNASDL